MYSRLRQGHPLLSYSSALLELPVPKNISSKWSFGSMLGLCLVTQIVTGLFLAMYFASDVSLAFDSTVYISRNVNFGWWVRSIHANGASMFFLCLYIHTGRGLYYGSYQFAETWSVGVTLLFVTIGTAFLGYVLPWGQMSYWAATVITNLVSAIPYLGETVVAWLWGGFSVSNATLVRFYAFHFILPMLIAALSLVHIFYLHQTGSSNPLGVSADLDVIKFHPYLSVKDVVGFLGLWLLLGSIVLFDPNLLIDPENFIPANPLVTPTHIQPEWYFLPMYAILRSIPSKLGGVVALAMSIGVLYLLPLTSLKFRSSGVNPIRQASFWFLVGSFFVLMWIGSQPVEAPYEMIGRWGTVVYFLLYLGFSWGDKLWSYLTDTGVGA